MQHTVTVTQTAGNAAGWAVKCFKWASPHDTHPVEYPLYFQRVGNDYVATTDLPPGVYSLVCDLWAGVTLDIDLAPPSQRIQPAGPWPLQATPKPQRPYDTLFFYFQV